MANKKTLALAISLLCIQNAYGSEEEQPGAMIPYTSVTLPTFGDVAAASWSWTSSLASSAVTTATNYMSDDAAFAKLGYPPTNDVNKAELAKFVAIQARYEQDILANVVSVNFATDEAYVNRRQGFLARLIKAAPSRSDGTEMALFALEHYPKVMNYFDNLRLIKFVESKRQSSEQAAQTINSKLSTLVLLSGSQLIGSALQGSYAQKQEQPVVEDFIAEEKK